MRIVKARRRPQRKTKVVWQVRGQRWCSFFRRLVLVYPVCVHIEMECIFFGVDFTGAAGEDGRNSPPLRFGNSVGDSGEEYQRNEDANGLTAFSYELVL